jgi:hypothetical protein
MLRRNRYKLKAGILGIETIDGHRVTATIDEGAVVLVKSGPQPNDTRMFDIEWDNRQLVVFLVDLMERGELVASP